MKKMMTKAIAVVLVFCMLTAVLPAAFAAPAAAPAKTEVKGPLIDMLDELFRALIIYALIEGFVQALKDGAVDWYNADTDTYNLYTALDFIGFTYLVNTGVSFENKTVNLRRNINITNEMFFPVGSNYTNTFCGTFDGHGHSISGADMEEAYLLVENTGLNLEDTPLTVGLFGNTENAVIQNLTLSAPKICADTKNLCVGTIVGQAVGTTVENCTVTVPSIDASFTNTAYMGGITGYASNSFFTRCQLLQGSIALFGGSVQSAPVYLGGGAALCDDTIFSDCSVQTQLSVSNDTILSQPYSAMGYLRNSTVKDSYCGGSLYASGQPCVFPFCAGENITAENNYTADTTPGTPYAQGVPVSRLTSGEISYLLNTQNGTAENRGLWSYNAAGPRLADHACIATCQVTFMAQNTVYGINYTNSDGTAKNMDCTLDYFQGWFSDSDCTQLYDFQRVVRQDTVVYADINAQIPPKDENGNYLVSNAQQLLTVCGYTEYYPVSVLLTSDIDFNEETAAGASFIPRFSGVLDGGGHTVKNVFVDGGANGLTGLVGVITNGTVKNIIFENMDIKTSGTSCGIFATAQQTTVFENCTVKSSQISGGDYTAALLGFAGNSSQTTIQNSNIINTLISGYDHTGGLFGGNAKYNAAVTMENCSFGGSINAYGECTGGIAGCIYGGTIRECRTTADGQVTVYTAVSPTGVAGGIVGNSVNSDLLFCENYASISSNTAAGGITGNFINGKISDCKNFAAVRTSADSAGGIAAKTEKGNFYFCTNTGTVTASKNFAGGITAQADASLIASCSNKGVIASGKTCSGGIAGIITGSTLAACYNVQAVNGTQYTGGITGYCKESSLYYGYNTAVVDGHTGTGSITGTNDNSSIAYFGALVLSSSVCIGFGSGKDVNFLTRAQLTSPSFIDMLNLEDTQFAEDTDLQNNGYPVLIWEKEAVNGDFNGDGSVTVSDVLAVQKHIAGLKPISACYMRSYVLHKKQLDILYVLAMQKEIAGIYTLL